MLLCLLTLHLLRCYQACRRGSKEAYIEATDEISSFHACLLDDMYLFPIAFCGSFDCTHEYWTEFAWTIIDQGQFVWFLRLCAILKKRWSEALGKTTHLLM